MKKPSVLESWMAKLMVNRKAFTLIEVLISIALMGLILVPLFNVVEMMRSSNDQLLHALEKSTQITKATKVLFLDIMSSDGNFTLKKDEMSRFCMEETTNSLYELPVAKVCWLVLKENNTLVRAEGNAYKLPLNYEDKVEVDTIMTNIEMFDVFREKKKDKVLVVIKQKEKEPISFLVQGIWGPKPLGAFLRDASGKILYSRTGVPRRINDGLPPDPRAVNDPNRKKSQNRSKRKRLNGTRPPGAIPPGTGRPSPQGASRKINRNPNGGIRKQ